jgi:hypothetical protein
VQILDEIEHDVDTCHSADGDLLACECQAIRSVALSLKDEGRVALPLAQQCLTKSSDPRTANVASNVVRYWRCKTGDLREFYATRAYLASAQQRFDGTISTLERLRDDAEQVQNHYFVLRLATHLCIVRFGANQVSFVTF